MTTSAGGPTELVGEIRKKFDYQAQQPTVVPPGSDGGSFVVLANVGNDVTTGRQQLEVAAVVLGGGSYQLTPVADGMVVIDLKERLAPTNDELRAVLAADPEINDPVYAPTRPPVILP